jgi:hypothetical protein
MDLICSSPFALWYTGRILSAGIGASGAVLPDARSYDVTSRAAFIDRCDYPVHIGKYGKTLYNNAISPEGSF